MAPGIEGLEAYTYCFPRAIQTAIALSTQKKKINPNFSHKGFNDDCSEACGETRKGRRALT